MKNLKSALFNFLILLTISIVMTSCEKEQISPILDENQDVLPSVEIMNQLVNTDKKAIVDKKILPATVKVPVLTEEDMTNNFTKSTACIQYNAWNYTTPLGWIWAYNSSNNWFYSHKYKDFVWINSQDDVCDGGGILFHTYHNICGREGWLYDYDAAENNLWHWRNSTWTSLSCGVCDNNDFTSRFMDLINQYKYLEGAAASSGVTNFANNLFEFRDLVQTGAPLDIKNTNAFLINLGNNGCGVKFFGRDVAVDVPGNVLYGFIGRLYWKNKFGNNTGLFLGAASGLAQSISDGNGDSFSPALLLESDDWLFLTSGDPWCDTYAVYFGDDMASTYGSNISISQFTNNVNSNNTWLNEPNYNCPAPYSPTGWCEDGSYGPC